MIYRMYHTFLRYKVFEFVDHLNQFYKLNLSIPCLLDYVSDLQCVYICSVYLERKDERKGSSLR